MTTQGIIETWGRGTLKMAKKWWQEKIMVEVRNSASDSWPTRRFSGRLRNVRQICASVIRMTGRKQWASLAI